MKNRSMTVAYALWFFLGGLGVHLVYLRRWGMLAVHWVAAAVLTYAFVTEVETRTLLFAWIAILAMEGGIVWHQVEVANKAISAQRVARRAW